MWYNIIDDRRCDKIAEYNNFKQIREIYGATQDEVAKAIGVNRATVSQWENGATRASNSNIEKLSVFFCIDKECFYELPVIDENYKELLIGTAKRAKEIKEASDKELDKITEFNIMFKSITFSCARKKYMFAIKMLLATADSGKLEDLRIAYQINEKTAKRLKAIIEIRENEELEKAKTNQETLFDLIGKLSE